MPAVTRETILDNLPQLGAVPDNEARVRFAITMAGHAARLDDGGLTLADVRAALTRYIGPKRAAAIIDDHLAGRQTPAPAPAPGIRPAAPAAILPLPIDAQTHTVQLDPELARLAVGLGFALPLLAWAAGRKADQAGRGIVSEMQIVDALRTSGGKADVKAVRRWVQAGAGVFFQTSPIGIHLTGYARASERLTALAFERELPDLVMTNPTGAPFVFVPVAHSKKEWAANIYAAWHNGRADQTRQISRFTLERLWNTTRAQLLKWEKSAGISTTRVYALHTMQGSDIPAYAEPILTRRENTVQYRTRHSNAYTAPSYRIKHHKKIIKAVRRRARRLIDIQPTEVMPIGNCGLTAGNGAKGGQLAFTGRLVFFDQDGAHAAAKRLQSHYRHTRDDGRRHYIELGRDRFGNIVIEQSNDGLQRCARNDVAAREVADGFFRRNGGRGAWCEWLRGA